MSANHPETDVINMEELKEIMDGDMDLIKDCFADFVQDYQASFDEIKNAATEKNGPKLDSAAHKLKGTLRYLAAANAADAAYALELSGKSNDMDGIAAKLDLLAKECVKLVEYIQNFEG